MYTMSFTIYPAFGISKYSRLHCQSAELNHKAEAIADIQQKIQEIEDLYETSVSASFQTFYSDGSVCQTAKRPSDLDVSDITGIEIHVSIPIAPWDWDYDEEYEEYTEILLIKAKLSENSFAQQASSSLPSFTKILRSLDVPTY